MDLLGEAAAAVADHQARHRQHQRAVLAGQLLGRAHEDAPRAVDQAGFAAGGHQAHDQVLELLAVTRLVLVPDHQVHRQAFLPPVGVGLDQLLHQGNVGQVAHLQQDDRQVAGNALAPEPGLAAPVGLQQAVVGAQGGVGVEQRSCHLLEQPGLGQGRVELAQQHLAVGPGQVEDPVRQVPVAVFVDQLQAVFTAFGDPGHQVDGGALAGVEGDPAADRHDRVEHRPGAAREPLGLRVQGLGRGQVAATADKARAVGFIGNRVDVHAVGRQQVAHPGHRLLLGTWPAAADDGLPIGQQLGLDEQVAEGRVGGIAWSRGQHHFGVAGELDAAAYPGAVADVQAAQLDGVFGGHDDFRVAVEVLFTHAEFGPGVGEDRLEA